MVLTENRQDFVREHPKFKVVRYRALKNLRESQADDAARGVTFDQP